MILRTNHRERCACFQYSHGSHHKINTSMRVDHNHFFPLDSILYEVVSKDVGRAKYGFVCKDHSLLGAFGDLPW